ncbi:MAG: hypothetical protein QM737_14895 [Ferruginibacter sp.]
MKYFLIPFLTLVISYAVPAHPGIGIVKDSKGNIYYTDLKNIWKITVDGKRVVVVTGVHTHELYMDANDDLYGEHLWYNGKTLNTWGRYVWCLRHTGKLDTILNQTGEFLNDYSFVRDGAGNMYWVQRFTVSKFKKRTKNGQVITIAEGKFKNIRWMHAAKNGTIYFVDLTDLYKLENGKFTLLKKDLHERTSVLEYTSLDHNVYGIWLDKNENIYVAIMGGQVVKKITATGTVTNVVYSPGPWKPCSGLFDDEGAMWLMETNTANEVRVRKIKK